MATGDKVIPNPYTELLERLSGAPRRDYGGGHGFLVIPVLASYWKGTAELTAFLLGELEP